MGFFKEFKEFAMRGNVIDLAVGVIIGGAFGKIVNSIVADIVMPPIGYLIGDVKFTDLKYPIRGAEKTWDAAKQTYVVSKEAVTLNYGNFIQTIFEFIIIALSIFVVIKVINRLAHLRKKEEEAAPKADPIPTKEEILLTEIRDILKSK
jgi:large conductance mechanosensitive channel